MKYLYDIFFNYSWLKLLIAIIKLKSSYLSAIEVEKMADISSLDLTRVKEDLINAHRECSKRRLLHGAKW